MGWGRAVQGCGDNISYYSSLFHERMNHTLAVVTISAVLATITVFPVVLVAVATVAMES